MFLLHCRFSSPHISGPCKEYRCHPAPAGGAVTALQSTNQIARPRFYSSSGRAGRFTFSFFFPPFQRLFIVHWKQHQGTLAFSSSMGPPIGVEVNSLFDSCCVMLSFFSSISASLSLCHLCWDVHCSPVNKYSFQWNWNWYFSVNRSHLCCFITYLYNILTFSIRHLFSLDCFFISQPYSAANVCRFSL